MLRSLFIDFNSYFASVEQQLDPALRGRPVGVVPVMADSSSCIAASIEAKAFGVKTGTRVSDAKRLCPGIALVLADHAKYVQVHQQAVAVVDRLAQVRQVVSIDEMECELTGRWRERDRAVALALQIKAALLAEVGQCMRTSVGIAPNTLLGKLASDMHKPDGLTVIEQHELPERLFHLKLSAIQGIGPRLLERLARCGIGSVEQLYAAPRDLLHTAWGGLAGSDMYDRLRGQWYGPRATVARSLGHSHVLPPDLRHPAGAHQVLHRLTQKAAMRLRKQGFYATAMQVFVHCANRWQREAGGERDPRRAVDEGARLGDHQAPGGQGGRDAEAEEGQGGFQEDGQGHFQGGDDDEVVDDFFFFIFRFFMLSSSPPLSSTLLLLFDDDDDFLIFGLLADDDDLLLLLVFMVAPFIINY